MLLGDVDELKVEGEGADHRRLLPQLEPANGFAQLVTRRAFPRLPREQADPLLGVEQQPLKVKAPTARRPRAWTPGWWNEPVYTSPPVPVARLDASAGTAKSPVASVPHTPAIPCTETAPIGSSIPIRSMKRTPATA